MIECKEVIKMCYWQVTTFQWYFLQTQCFLQQPWRPQWFGGSCRHQPKVKVIIMMKANAVEFRIQEYYFAVQRPIQCAVIKGISQSSHNGGIWLFQFLQHLGIWYLETAKRLSLKWRQQTLNKERRNDKIKKTRIKRTNNEEMKRLGKK